MIGGLSRTSRVKRVNMESSLFFVNDVIFRELWNSKRNYRDSWFAIFNSRELCAWPPLTAPHCCDSMLNISPGAKRKFTEMRKHSRACSRSFFRRGMKKHDSDYMDFSARLAGLKILARFEDTGLGLLVRAELRPGACFSKAPKLFGRISEEIILFVSSKRRRLETRNFAVIVTFIPLTTYEKTSFTE